MKKISSWSLSFLLVFALLLGLAPAQAATTTAELGEVQAAAVYLMDTSYDAVLYEKNAHERRAPASITKVMTALLVLEAIDRGELKTSTIITATDAAIADMTPDSSTQNIQPGEEMSVENLLYCLLVPSANESANILAIAVSGSIPAFLEKMNARALELGMTNTNFMNPHGLHHDNHFSSAYDISLMLRQAMTQPLFQKIVGTASYTVPATNLAQARTFYNTNAMISGRKYPGYTYSAATGVKTGTTPEAGSCLASSAQKNERSLIAVVLGAETTYHPNGSVSRMHFTESRRLLQWGFAAFAPRVILQKDALLREVPVKNGKGVSYVVGIPAKEIEAVLPAAYDAEKLYQAIAIKSEYVKAPVAQGQVLGSVTLSYDGKDYGTVDIVAANAISYSMLRMIGTTILETLQSVWFWLALALVSACIVLRYRRALKRAPRRATPSNVHHIDSARGATPFADDLPDNRRPKPKRKPPQAPKPRR